jgi:Family of unknown function (DUF5908)
MTIEIRQLVVRAVVESSPAGSANRAQARPVLSQSQEGAIVARCTRAVLQTLKELAER